MDGADHRSDALAGLVMAAKVGDRVEFGSEVEPCGGAIVSIKDGVAIIHWDGGGECATTVLVLEALSCGEDAEPEARPA
jgi:hypothetical protein